MTTPLFVRRLLLSLALAALFGVAAGAASAQGDPPGRVGRLSYMEGTVSFHTADQDQWSPATLNYPVATGSSFWTEPGSRAEIEVGSAEFRLDETTALDVLALDDHTMRLQLEQGVLNVHLHGVPRGSVEVMTPLGIVDLVEAGSYHIDAGHGDDATPPDRVEVTVLEGKAEASGPRHRIEILPGERAVIAGDPATLTLAEGGSTAFDDWALERERREEVRASARYVSPELTGYQDLDDYGQWATSPAYGAVWYPSAVPVDWAPYRYGHWAWVPPWGWTWIDDAPWGFAPFHYGRWAEIDGRWGWCPGAVVARPVYAPALVAFIGGGGWSVTIGAGSAVGWVPLAPFEVYHPYYRTSVTYIRNVNITNVHVTEINQITSVRNVNASFAASHFANHQAATVVRADAFTHAAPVHRETLAVNREALARAPVTPSIAHFRPTPIARAGVAAPAAAGPHANAPAAAARAPRPGATPPLRAEPRDERRETAPPAAPGPRFAAHPLSPLPPAIQHPAPAPGGAPRIEAAPRPMPGTPAPHPAIGTPPRPVPSAPAPHPAVGTPPRPVPGAPPPHPPVGATPQTANRPPAPAATRPAQVPNRPVQVPNRPVQVPNRPVPPPGIAARTPPRPPLVQIERPAQQTRLAPTPQGWVRSPPQARPAATPQKPAAPAQGHGPRDEHKPGG